MGAFQEPAPGPDRAETEKLSLGLTPSNGAEGQPAPFSRATDAPGLGAFFDGPMSGILLGNAVTMAGAMIQHWPAYPVMVVYWWQSLVMLLSQLARILMVDEFSNQGWSAGLSFPDTPSGRRLGVLTFIQLNGTMFAGLGIILFGFTHHSFDHRTRNLMVVNVLLFAATHLWHVFASRGDEFLGKPNLGTMTIYPFLRLLPMYLGVLFLGLPVAMLPCFILLKTAADIGTYQVERRVYRSAPTGAE